MPVLNVKAHIDINATREQVQHVLTDFQSWPAWSPWLYIEPEAKLTYRGGAGEIGHGYDWLGDKTGSGGMSLTKISAQRVECDLQFLKPFKSQADIAFDLEELAPDITRVTWLMDSSLPFFMFWMKESMSGMIKADYARGLALLKDYIEKEKIPSSASDAVKVSVPEVSYVGIQATCSMSDIASVMGTSFDTLSTASTNGQFSVSGRPFCLYNDIDFKRQRFTFTAAMPCDEGANVDAPLVAAHRPACTALKVMHTGAFRHLPNAWAKLLADAKAQKHKPVKSQHPFELYLNDATDIDEAELLTELYLPLKS